MYIIEKYYDSVKTTTPIGFVDFTIYKNPDSREIKNSIPSGARGWISPDGDLYIEGDTQGIVIHRFLLKELSKCNVGITSHYVDRFDSEPYLKYEDKYGICVQRSRSSLTMAVSESIPLGRSDKDKIREVYRKAKLKNPMWTFVTRSIMDY